MTAWRVIDMRQEPYQLPVEVVIQLVHIARSYTVTIRDSNSQLIETLLVEDELRFAMPHAPCLSSEKPLHSPRT
jgi:hypothetical protein